MLFTTPSSLARRARAGASTTCGHATSPPAAASPHRRRAPRLPALRAAASSQQSSGGLSEEELSQRVQGSVVVLGAGPAGLATAAALQAVGLPALVLERDTQLSTGGTALGMWTNAWRALEALGAAEPLRQLHPRVDTVELCRSTGRRLRSFSLADCDGGPHEFRGVLRANLLRALAARLAPGTLLLGCRVEGAGATPTGAMVRLAGSPRELGCLAVVGADGASSAAAPALGRGPPRYVGQSAIRGIAAYPEGVPCNAIRQIWGEGPRAGMYPISGTELYWFCCFDDAPGAPGPASPEGLREEALRQVAGWGWGVREIVERTPAESLVRSRIADRWDLPSGADDVGAVTLAGDALHPMTPNLGQGGCTALEDSVVLARLLRDSSVPQLLGATPRGSAGAAAAVARVFREYERARARRCLPLTVRSFAMGALLQLPLPPVVAARDLFVERAFSPAHFLDHAAFDCGGLEGAPRG